MAGRLNEPADGWNGRWAGEALPAGVYVYVARVRKIDGEVEEVSGSVMLVR